MYPNSPSRPENSPVLSSLLILFGFILIGMVVGNVVSSLGMIWMTDLSFQDFQDLGTTLRQHPNGWYAMIFSQGMASLIMFTGAGLLYWRLIEKRPFRDFNSFQNPSPGIFLFVYLIHVVSLPLSSWIQAANERMKLPQSLQALETYMRSMEDRLADLTSFLTTYDSFGQFLLAFLVIAVIAGFGEELIFRGLLQRKLQQGFGNAHIAIWLSAFVFSAIHFQFYGFFPRLFLGAMFGYFYWWSGNLWVAVAGHIFNNGLAVLVMYLIHLKKISPELEKMDQVPVYGIVASALLTGFGLWYFQRYVQQEKVIA